jgi:tRNA 2-selenouridine synthase
MQISPPVFFNWKMGRTIVDVRPADAFRKGHFPGAVSFPAGNFASTEALLQSLYGMGLAQPFHLIDLDESIAGTATQDCDINFLQGGYKAYKAWMNEAYASGPAIGIIGGKTGSGKTTLLRELASMGRQVLDIEAIAKHRGSVFGGFNSPQPSLEQFEYNLLKAWLSLDLSMPVWMEEKSAVLGKLGIPKILYRKMFAAVWFELDQPFESRLRSVHEEYTVTDKRRFMHGIRQLETRMGFSNNHKALHYYATGQTDNCLRLLLRYYDAAYDHNRTKHHSKLRVVVGPDAFREHTAVLAMEKMIMDAG